MHKRLTVLGLLALAAAWTLRPTTAHASASPRGKSRKPAVDRGPAETRAERDKRLLRECRGKPNAGACEGYAN